MSLLDAIPATSSNTKGISSDSLPRRKEGFLETALRTAPKRLRWFRRFGKGIILDIRSRAPWYFSDWKDAWNYRVVPATALIFFAKYVHFYCFRVDSLILHLENSVLPGIAFSLDLIETTEQYGVAEVLMSSFMAAFIFSILGAQPLTIAGVTGVQDTFAVGYMSLQTLSRRPNHGIQ